MYLKSKKNFERISSAAKVICVLIVIVCVIKTIEPSKKNAEILLKRDKNELETIVTFLSNYDSDFYLHYRLYPDAYESLDDKDVRDAMKRLIKRGYETIEKDGNTIRFAIWNYFQFSAGLAYSVDGVNEPHISYLIKLKPLSKTGWYYYQSE